MRRLTLLVGAVLLTVTGATAASAQEWRKCANIASGAHALGKIERVIDSVMQQGTIWQAGQHIVQGLVFKPGLMGLALGNIAHHGYETPAFVRPYFTNGKLQR